MALRTVALPSRAGAAWDNLAWPAKASADELHYVLDCAAWLADADEVLNGLLLSWSPGLTVTAPGSVVGQRAITLVIAGGMPGTVATVRFLISLVGGDTLEVLVALPIRAAAPGGLVGTSPPSSSPHTADAGTGTADSATVTADAG